MTTPSNSSLTKDEPVVVGALVAWLFSVVGDWLLGHSTLVTSDTWSGLTTILVPVVSAAVLGGIAWLVRKVVSPTWKTAAPYVRGVENATGVSDQQLEHLAALLSKQVYTDLERHIPALVAASHQVDIALHPAPPAPAVE